MTKENEIVLFETEDKKVLLPVEVKDETVWLNRNQMAELFDRDVKTIGKHVNNALKDLQDINVSDIPAIGNIQIPESNVVPDIQSVAIKSAANIPDITAATSISTR